MRKSSNRISTLVFGVASLSLIACVLVFVPGCSWRSTPPQSVLVIAIEDLGFGSFSCDGETNQPEFSGFESFCNEAVRFTHAYAPSTLSQATIASLLTGLYPREHGVRHNGTQSLPAKIETLAEAARKKGFKTSLFSGGPPVWRRAALNQGFDVFDDNVSVTLKSTYRSATSVVDAFLGWQEDDASKGGFVSFLFLADPQFIDEPTTNVLGEVRESSYRSQVEEVGESITALVRGLKERKLWDSTTIFLVGLDGYVGSKRSDEPAGTNLFSESTRATLMIKPSRKKRDGPFTWKVDANVSLVDVGVTIFDLVDPAGAKPKSRFETISLADALTSPETDWSANRRIITESAWPEWRGHGGIRAALRSGPYLYLFDDYDQLYNTLTDTFEVTPLPLGEPRSASLRDEFASTLRRLDYLPWRASNRLAYEKTILAQDLWRERGPAADSLERLRALGRRHPKDPELRGWRALLALQANRWDELKSIAMDDEPVWKHVAMVNLNEKVPASSHPCLKALSAPSPEARKACPDDLTRELIEWASASDDETRNRAMESVLKASVLKALAEKIARQNAVAGDLWDVSRAPLAGPAISDLILALPEMRKYRSAIRARIASESR